MSHRTRYKYHGLPGLFGFFLAVALLGLLRRRTFFFGEASMGGIKSVIPSNMANSFLLCFRKAAISLRKDRAQRALYSAMITNVGSIHPW